MADRLEYLVPPAPFPGAPEELTALIQTLHESGTLRFLNGFFGRLGAINDVLVKEANSPEGRSLISTLLFVGECMTRIPPDSLERLARGFAAGVERAGQVMHAEPPGTIHLLRLLDEPETRRTIAAAATLLNSLTAEFATKRPAEKS